MCHSCVILRIIQVHALNVFCPSRAKRPNTCAGTLSAGSKRVCPYPPFLSGSKRVCPGPLRFCPPHRERFGLCSTKIFFGVRRCRRRSHGVCASTLQSDHSRVEQGRTIHRIRWAYYVLYSICINHVLIHTLYYGGVHVEGAHTHMRTSACTWKRLGGL